MNRINQTLNQDKKLLSIYFTAGFPQLEDTVPVLKQLQEAGVDMIELGLPFSDPLADGPTIQESSTQALKNGITTEVLFNQITQINHISFTYPVIGNTIIGIGYLTNKFF